MSSPRERAEQERREYIDETGQNPALLDMFMSSHDAQADNAADELKRRQAAEREARINKKLGVHDAVRPITEEQLIRAKRRLS
ncbi:MAG: hypothetical protein LRZ84_14555 [Desertifilum sp.]|nr:hypothetical protein [Desertifilum sp.]